VGARDHVTVATAKGAWTTYSLGVEKRSYHVCDCKGCRDDVLPGGGGKRGQITLANGRDNVQPGGGRRMESKSDHGCDCKVGREDVQPEWGQGIM
jgi:hypothetical protein